MKKIILVLLFLVSNVLFAQEKNNLVYKESIYSVEILIENGKDYLELDKENKIQIVTKKIQPINMSCIGQNLKKGKRSTYKNNSNWTLIVNKENLKDGKYSLLVNFRGKKGKLFTHEFLIPIQ